MCKASSSEAAPGRSVALVRVVRRAIDPRPGQPDTPQLPVAEAEQDFSRGFAFLARDPGRQPIIDTVADVSCELPAYGNGGGAGEVGNHGHGLSSGWTRGSEEDDYMAVPPDKDFEKALICRPFALREPRDESDNVAPFAAVDSSQ